jgi:hypothetical protein
MCSVPAVGKDRARNTKRVKPYAARLCLCYGCFVLLIRATDTSRPHRIEVQRQPHTSKNVTIGRRALGPVSQPIVCAAYQPGVNLIQGEVDIRLPIVSRHSSRKRGEVVKVSAYGSIGHVGHTNFDHRTGQK